MEATTEPKELVVDPCVGSFVVLEACQETGREFMGIDLTYEEMKEFRRERERERRLVRFRGIVEDLSLLS